MVIRTVNKLNFCGYGIKHKNPIHFSLSLNLILHIDFFIWLWKKCSFSRDIFFNVSNSSSPLTANCKCLGVILFTFNSLLPFPANSKTSTVKYSKIAAVYTAAITPTLPILRINIYNTSILYYLMFLLLKKIKIVKKKKLN